MHSDNGQVAAEKLAFEPSTLLEYGDVEQMTQLNSGPAGPDGPYTS